MCKWDDIKKSNKFFNPLNAEKKIFLFLKRIFLCSTVESINIDTPRKYRELPFQGIRVCGEKIPMSEHPAIFRK